MGDKSTDKPKMNAVEKERRNRFLEVYLWLAVSLFALTIGWVGFGGYHEGGFLARFTAGIMLLAGLIGLRELLSKK